MKVTVVLTLMLTVGCAGGFAHESLVKMNFSGNSAPSPANLQQPNSGTGEENVSGKSNLGSFAFRNITAAANSPSTSGTCSGADQAYFPRLAGGGLFRFEDGSLLKVSLVEGGDCIDFAAKEGHCTLAFNITGGTGRFKNASGTLSYTETATPVLLDATSNPVFFTEVGEITGTISGLTSRDEHEGQNN